MKTIIPAQPGYFVVYSDGSADPILAWEITPVTVAGKPDHTVWPITLRGRAGNGHGFVEWVEYRTESGSTITVRG